MKTQNKILIKNVIDIRSHKHYKFNDNKERFTKLNKLKSISKLNTTNQINE